MKNFNQIKRCQTQFAGFGLAGDPTAAGEEVTASSKGQITGGFVSNGFTVNPKAKFDTSKNASG
jgi:hypothetical protein